MQFHHDNPILYKFFHQNLQQVFKDLGLPGGEMLDYIAFILTYFVRTSNLYRIKQLSNFNLETVVEALLELEERRHPDDPISASDEMLVRKHIGDFTLFMSGIFREYVQRIGILDFYLLEGSRSYHHVFDFVRDQHPESAPVFHQLSQDFESYSGALDYMKKVYFYYPDIDDLIQHTIRNLLTW
ncbi:MAG: hypothetical protein JSW07_17515 [bacterium]|nr:MAG: hypothetical protein JSW07_17515 [bacterium]